MHYLQTTDRHLTLSWVKEFEVVFKLQLSLYYAAFVSEGFFSLRSSLFNILDSIKYILFLNMPGI